MDGRKGNEKDDILTKNVNEWFRAILTKIFLRVNIQILRKMSQRKWNKLIKMINGNRIFKKQTKPNKFFKVVTWNKGNSYFRSENEKFFPIKTAIEDQSGEIIVLPEAEFSPKNEPDILDNSQTMKFTSKL